MVLFRISEVAGVNSRAHHLRLEIQLYTEFPYTL